MKKSLLLLMVLLFSMNLFGSTYSVRSPYSRIGVYALWEWDWHQTTIPDSACSLYYAKIDSADVVGFSWFYPLSLHWQTECTPPGFGYTTRDSIQNADGSFIESKLNNIDSVLIRLKLMGYEDCFIAGTWPRKAGSYDTSYGGENYPDSIRFYWYFRVLVEMYDGDGIPAWDSISDSYYPERTDNLGNPLIIKYWEICHEPGWNSQWWPAQMWSIDSSTGIYQITNIHRSGIDSFQIYCKAASRGIHDANPDAIVMGPNIQATQTHHTHPNESAWRLIPYLDPNLYPSIPDIIEYMSYPVFLDSLLIIRDDSGNPTGETLFNYFDIISIKVNSYDRTDDFEEVDCMIDSCYALGYIINQPIWLHSIAWTDSLRDKETQPARANSILCWLGTFLSQDVVERVHIFTLLSPIPQSLYNLINSNGNFVVDAIQAFIKRNTPNIRLCYPDGGDVLYSGSNCSIYFDNVYDTNTTVIDNSIIVYNSTELTNIKVRIEYSINGGNIWYLIADNVPVGNQILSDEIGNGIYNWQVPMSLTNKGKLRVYAWDTQKLYGVCTSDNYFTIRTPLWTLDEPLHPLEWVDTLSVDTFDEVDYILEMSDTSYNHYVMGIKVSEIPGVEEGTGLVRYSPDSGFYNITTFLKSDLSWINCIIEREGEDQLIIVGECNGDDNRVIKVVEDNQNFTLLCQRKPGPGEICRIIKEIQGDGYIVTGWNDTLEYDRCWLKRFILREDDSEIGHSKLFIQWDNNFANSFNTAQILGRFYSLIKTTDSCYVAVGHRNSVYGGVSIFKFDDDGVMLDSASFHYTDSGWACAYDVIEDTFNGGYVMVGRREGWEGGLVIKVDSLLDTVWTRLFYDDSTLDPLTLYSLNSVIINEDGDIITSGCGYNELANDDTTYMYHEIGLLLRLDPTNGDLLSVTAPLSGLYSNNWKRSYLRPMYKTRDGGFISGCWLYNDSTYNKVIAICKLGYEIKGGADRAGNGSVLGLENFSVLCANSLFREKSTIRFVLPRQCNVNIVVYNVLGQRVRTLVNEEREPGAYEIFWDGTDNRGINVSSGSYFLRFQAGDFQSTKSLTVIR